MSDESAQTPERILQAINAFQSSAALKGALDLGLFTAVGRESKTAASLAATVGASERGMRILCDFLVISGFLQKEASEYRSSPDSALFLDENSPAYLGSVSRFMLGSDVLGNFSDIAAVVRKGGTLMDGQGTVEPNNPLWVDFALSMSPLVMPAADYIGNLVTKDVAGDKSLKVLDVASGHGMFGIGIATRHPKAEVVAVDWPAVLDVASKNAEKAGVADRLTLLPGNAFDVDFGDEYDIVLVTNFLHHFDVPMCTNVMCKVHGALNDGGRAVILDFVPNEDRVTPPEQASFSLTMLATTVSGDAYTFNQLEGMAADAGFAKSELHRIEGSSQSVIVTTK